MSLDYLGHESVSTYTVSGNVAGTDGNDWSVEVWDDSIDNWTTPFTFEFGLDSNNSTSYDNLRLRITPANQSTAQSLSNGHTVDIRFTSADGYQFEQEVVVRIPQFHNFELREPLLDIYGIRPGEELSIPILFTNSEMVMRGSNLYSMMLNYLLIGKEPVLHRTPWVRLLTPLIQSR